MNRSIGTHLAPFDPANNSARVARQRWEFGSWPRMSSWREDEEQLSDRMSYELKRGELFAKGIRRIMLEQVDAAAAILTDPRRAGGVDRSIHEARKRFKRIRSALRLGRNTLGKRQYRRENKRFRELGSLLALPRERAVAVLTLDRLSAASSSTPGELAFPELRAHLIELRVAAVWHTVERDRSIRQVSRRLRKARRELKGLSIRNRSELAWRDALTQAYRAGRVQMRHADLDGSPEVFHEWRKEVKHLRYHLDVLKRAWTGQLDRAETLLHELSDLLGLQHDLVDLRWHLDNSPASRSTARRREEACRLHTLIETARLALESRALEVGERIYSRKPKAVVKRVVSCWRSWQRYG